MKKACLLMVTLSFFICGSGCIKTEEGTIIKKEETTTTAETAPKTQYELDKESTLEAITVSDTTVKINLTNNTAVRAVQFTLEGTTITGLHTTERTTDYLAKFNAENGKIILVSLSRATISPGTGAILKVECKDASKATITNVKIVK